MSGQCICLQSIETVRMSTSLIKERIVRIKFEVMGTNHAGHRHSHEAYGALSQSAIEVLGHEKGPNTPCQWCIESGSNMLTHGTESLGRWASETYIMGTSWPPTNVHHPHIYPCRVHRCITACGVTEHASPHFANLPFLQGPRQTRRARTDYAQGEACLWAKKKCDGRLTAIYQSLY